MRASGDGFVVNSIVSNLITVTGENKFWQLVAKEYELDRDLAKCREVESWVIRLDNGRKLGLCDKCSTVTRGCAWFIEED